MKKLVQFKLPSGEWIIGELVGKEKMALTSTSLIDFSDSIFVKQPLTIGIFPAEGSYGVRFLPFDPLNTDGIKNFNKACIVGETLEISTQVIDAYTKQTSSIEIVSSIPGV